MAQEHIDFRTRVAAEKRDRMRARLLAATMEVCGGPNARGAVVDDVVRAAGVSRGAFYRHFQSLDEAIAELVADLIAEIVATARTVFPDVREPVLGSALGSQLMLYRAAMDRAWAGFVSRTNLILEDPSLELVMRQTIGVGGQQGAFRFASLSAAMDVFVGGLLAGVRHLGSGEDAPAGYISEMSLMLLRGLGAPEAAAEEAVAAARERIWEVGPRRLAWWRGT